MPECSEKNPLGDVTIRKCNYYSPMSWVCPIKLEALTSCISKYGGLIAVIHGDLQTNKRPDLVVYNASGKEISSFRWNSGTLIGVAWTHADDLLCIQEDGQILLYNVFCQYQRSFTMGKECRDNKVLEYEVFTSQHGTGVAVMNGLFRFLVVTNIDEPKPRLLADLPGLKNTPPSCWSVLSGSRSSRVIAANDNDIYLLDFGGQCYQQHPSDLNANVTSFISMSISLDGKHIALFSDTGLLWIGSADFQKKYCEFNTGDGSRPKQLLWCCESISPSSHGSNLCLGGYASVVIYRLGIVLIVGPKKDWVKYHLDGDYLSGALLGMDVDGVHIVTSTEHSFIQYLPNSVESIFKVGSMAPGALLYDAEAEYERSSEKSDEYLRMLIDERKLESGVEQCMEAACVEFDPILQKKLLKAASFGKSFLCSMRLTDIFVQSCRTLRVLNAIRDPNVGYFLTAPQLSHLSMEVLIDRLVNRHLFHLAFQICNYLQLNANQGASRILSHWACYKVQQTDIDDDQVALAIQSKLKSAIGVSYASIAEKAIACGRKELAVKLLEFEPRASEQVRMLSKLGQHSLALEKAVLSGNTDLAYTAISCLRERSGLSDFFVALRLQPIAWKLHLKYCREQNEQMLKDLYEQEDDFINLAHCHIYDSMGAFRTEERVVSLHRAIDCFNKARDDFQAKVTEEEVSLLREQMELEQEFDDSFVESSLHETLRSLLMLKQIKKAEQLRKQFKVADKRWWWLRISTLAEQRNFSELENFSKSKKSPVGYLPFIEACLQHSAPDEVVKYLPKVAADKRVPALLKTGNVSKAAELAIQTKSLTDLDLVYKKCGSDHRDTAEKVRDVMRQVQRR